MKIAIVTDDGKTISAHFGRTRGFVVVTAENGRETGRETRTREGGCQAQGPGHEHEHQHEHNHGDGGHRCSSLIEMVADCEAVLARGTGGGMYRNLQAAGVRPIFTELENIDEAIAAFLEGKLPEHEPNLCH